MGKKPIKRQKGEVTELSALYDLFSISDPEKVLDFIARKTYELIKARKCVVLLYDKESGELIGKAGRGIAPGELWRTRTTIGYGVAGIAAKEKRPLIVNDTRKASARLESYAFDLGLKTFMAVPLIYRRRILGVIDVFDKIGGKFTRSDLRLVSAFANYASIALENARLYSQLEEEVKERTSELEEKSKYLEDEAKKLMATKSELSEAKERLEKGLRAQKEFIADASHELRTPLAVIQSNLDLALREKSKGQVNPQEVLITINNEIALISKMVADLVILARADAGVQKLQRKRVNLNSLIRRVYNKAKMLTEEKNITLNIGHLAKVIVRGDENELEKLIMNLVSNAIRYNKPGGKVGIELFKEGSQAKIVVHDTGIGIPKKDLPFIFERFYRVDKARSRALGGTGLGLSICKLIVEVHGGKIKVESRLGKGSKFSVFLPFKIPKKPLGERLKKD